MDQMKDYKQLIKELPSNTIVCAVGEFNPPTVGHELLVKTVKKLAEQKHSAHVIYTSPSKNSLIQEDKKAHYLNLMFPKTSFKSLNESKLQETIADLQKKYKKIILVVGTDQVTEMRKLRNVELVLVNKDPEADNTKMKQFASKGIYEEFKKKLPSTIRDIDGKRLMNEVRTGLGLEPIKEQIVFVKDELREKYFRGEIFNEGDIVESNGEKFTIVKRGSNHLLLKEETGKLISKWIQDVKPTEEKQMNESLTDKTLRSTDKIKVARVIASMLGIENAEASSNPENLVNMALRKMKTKSLNAESLMILDRMLKLATEVNIEYDPSLKPSKLKEGAIQPNGTDKIDTKTSEPMNADDKTADVKVKKGMITFYNYSKAQNIKEQKHKGKESQADHKKDNESDIDADFDSHQADKREVGHTLVSPGGQDNLRRRKVKYHLGEQNKEQTGMDLTKKIHQKAMTTYGKEGGHELTAQHIATDPEHTAKQKKLAQSFISRMQGVAEEVTTDKESKEVAKANLSAKHAKEKESLADKHAKEKETISEAAPFKTKEDAVKYAKEKVKTHRDNLDGIEIHAHSGGFDVNHTSNSSGRNSLQKIGAKHLGTIYKEEVELDEAKKKPLAGVVATAKPFDPFFEDNDYDQTIDVATPNTEIETSEEDDIDDAEIEAMIGDLSDDDLMDAYDEDELALVDDETGEEIPKSAEEDSLDEQALMEVLSRIERMKAKFRIRRTAAKRERATKIALKRYSNNATINKRSRRLAIKLMKNRLLRGRDPSKISVGEKERIERVIERRKKVVGRLAMRLAPRVRQIEKARMSHSKYTQGSQPSVF
jgi:phosphopantetheine adenylyltransferase